MSHPTRRTLLTHLLAGPAAAMVAPVAARAATAPERRRVRIQETHVAGLAYYDVAACEGRLAPGDTLALRREPGNPHDDQAIEVWTSSGLKLGYVPRHRNAPIAALMDAGVPTSAEVVSVGTYFRRPDVRFAVSVEV